MYGLLNMNVQAKEEDGYIYKVSVHLMTSYDMEPAWRSERYKNCAKS